MSEKTGMPYSAVPTKEPQHGMYPEVNQGVQPPPQQGYYPPPGQQAVGYYPQAPPQQDMSGYRAGQPVPVGTTIVMGSPANYQQAMAINDWFVANIFATLCCCWCIGAFGIWKSYECRQAKQRGDIQRAQQEAGTAKTLFIVAVVLGSICILISIGIVIFYAVFAAKAISDAQDSYDYWDNNNG